MQNLIEIGVDVGGTFTDAVCIKDGKLFGTKVSSTPKDPSIGVVESVVRLLKVSGSRPEDVQRLVHGCTVAINAILQKKGVTTGILMTRGFEDTLTIGRGNRSRLYDLMLDAETPEFIAPRRMRVGISERVDAQGNIVTPLDEEQVRDGVKRLKEQYNIKAIAVCYLFSFRNPSHELKTREIIKEIAPEIRVSVSCELDPIFREYERLCVTAFDAYIAPLVDAYLRKLEGNLVGLGITAPFQIIQSRGGITSAKLVREKPVNMIMSGPAGGAVAGVYVGGSVALGADAGNIKNNFILADIGGTSCDVTLIYQGKPLLTSESRVDMYPLRTPMIDVNSIGAGGGSIAWLDAAGGLRVGPQSAGADPGPACYQRGGQEATATDASMVLGYLNPDYFAGGEIKIDVDAAFKAVERVAKRLGMDVYTAAHGIHRVLNSRVADQIRLVSVKRGYDPRDFSLLAFGGAGPVHAGILAKELSIPFCIVPGVPGLLCALGFLIADIEHENSRTFVTRLERDGVIPGITSIFADLTARGNEQMVSDGVALRDIRVRKSADMRYMAQSYELEVPLPDEVISRSLAKAVADFHAQHEAVYGYSRPQGVVEFVNFRTVHYCSFPAPQLKSVAGKSLESARKGTRKVYFGEFMEVPIYERTELPVMQEAMKGPAIIEQTDSTTVVYPGQQFMVHPTGNIILIV